ncbi:MAG TPA: ABC transporter permease [Bryobacteraceae bacterium]|jgi:lipoprotein-releasing system permease protein|nr:ABC transporter permease [Bryobacteraceae bacterium]
MFELFIAKRYLRAKRKQVMISVITGISIIGVAAGVMALVIGLAINTGFRNTLERSLLGLTAHVSILEKEPSEGIAGWEQLSGRLARLPHVKSVAPALYDGGYLRGSVNGDAVSIKGISIAAGAPVPDALLHLKAGSIGALRGAEGDRPGIILGIRLAERLGAVVGKPVTLTVPEGHITPLGPRPSFVQLRVAGIFDAGFLQLDSSMGFMDLASVQKIFDLGDVVNSIELYLDDVDAAPQVASAAEPVIGPKLAATTWQEQNRPLLNALRMERVVTVVSIGLIQVVAALNILIALVMMVMEKHRDIAILMSMGARAKQIRRIFVWEGAMIGAVGTVIGLTLGYTICYFADKYQWLRLDEEVYSISFVPFTTRWVDGVWIAAAAMSISLIATLYPARSATKVAPVESLRYE